MRSCRMSPPLTIGAAPLSFTQFPVVSVTLNVLVATTVAPWSSTVWKYAFSPAGTSTHALTWQVVPAVVLLFQEGESIIVARPELVLRVTCAANDPECAVVVRLRALPAACFQPVRQSHSKPGLPTRLGAVTSTLCCFVVLRPAESMTSTVTM